MEGGDARARLLPGDDRAPPLQQEMTTTASRGPAGVGALAAQAFDTQDELMLQQERSPAYQVLHDSGLINNSYRRKSAADLQLVPPNSSMITNVLWRSTSCLAGLCIGRFVYDCVVVQFSVRDGGVRPGYHKSGQYLLFGSGVHRMVDPFVSVEEEDIPLTTPCIVHGTQYIVTVPQGFVGLAMDRGQPALLSPGLHQWRSSTMWFERLIDLSAPVIQIGPFTLITVDQGYSAVTEDNGQQKVLAGGRTYMLTHRNWKFEKFITEKIQTSDLGPIRATTGDNVPLETTATVCWRIEDPALAARMAASTMRGLPDEAPSSRDAPNLRTDVLNQATASLAAYIGSIRYSDVQHVSAKMAQAGAATLEEAEPAVEPPEAFEEKRMGTTAIFDKDMVGGAVAHANSICMQYGVRIISINVISAFPSDQHLMEALSAGAVAAAKAEQAETAARGTARATLISAEAEAQANRLRARGAADAAQALERAGGVAVELARLEKVGEAVAGATNFFVAEGPAALGRALLGGGAVGAAGAALRPAPPDEPNAWATAA